MLATATAGTGCGPVLESMRTQARIRPVLCLVHTWDRLAHDGELRIARQQRVAQAGGYVAALEW
ncbi:hypothetical protein ADK76_25785 [Streptomyces griseoflavus]|uniref:hypothetical protein n=1 Tax=Streptomyces rimosus TaxID=1927 RepID=UPI0004C79C1A|nr:hypothetical protein [Streptomyces rimosus]KOG53898.1 hypothetical protein ADK76_25785 [Streptomyces griseoflavus]